ncbi:EamA family transporter [Inhella gelatinilytica]|uniref:EamA family transporter n=1 Tax=Inhella gelatinilytica TaxID=2795030 RepID=A0A931NBH1_9BURK|nr:EamA family transporter [Inhella gelatinilytica]MBH9553578.1 EamA family transporter [Inhella gelatinilytica]
MPPRHALLALAVVGVWGSNFVVMKWALQSFPPLWLATLRFALSALPLLVLPRPPVSWRVLGGYGLLIGVGMFGLLFVALQTGISPGLASLVVQSQVFFTLLMLWALKGQGLKRLQGWALACAALGVVWIAAQQDAAATPLGLLLTLMAALSWAVANVVGQAAGRVNMLAFMVWSSAAAAPALALVALTVEGAAAFSEAVTAASPAAWAAVGWQAVGNTLFGYGAWGWLLARHNASAVVPWALLVPVVGMACSWLLLGEPLPAWKWAGAGAVMVGLLLNTWALRR